MRDRVVLTLGPDEQVVVSMADLRSKNRLARAIERARKLLQKRRAASVEHKPLWF